MKKHVFILVLMLINLSAFAEEKGSISISSGNTYLDLLLIALTITVFILLLVAVVILRTFTRLSKEILQPTPFVNEPKKLLEYSEWQELQKQKPGIWSKILGLKPIEQEKDILLEHQFDGISELDNPTPAWFMWLFYGTIIIGVLYFLNYHVLGWGKLQDEEYAIEVQEAEIAKKEYLAKTANLIDENSVKENTDASVVAAGQAIFNSNCVACHGDKGQGVVGPNLTDEYWLHGGKINDVFKIIKYGVPEKGMISWEKTLTPKQISDVSNYIKSLKGSNPPNPKAPQGDKEG